MDLVPGKTWKIEFVEIEGAVFEMLSPSDIQYLDATEIAEPIFNEEATRRQRDEAKLKLYEMFIVKSSGIEESEITFDIKLNIGFQVVKHINPDMYELKK